MESRIFTIGVFDVLHEGHLNLLYKLSLLGKLYIGVVNDEAVKNKKGINRPVMDEQYRVKLLRNLKFVTYADVVKDFDYNTFWANECEIVAIGEDQKDFKGLETIPQNKLIILPRTEGVSTSDIIRRINNGT